MPQAEYRQPLELSGALRNFKHENTTSEIDREFPDVNIVNELLHDLAITNESMMLSFKLSFKNAG